VDFELFEEDGDDEVMVVPHGERAIRLLRRLFPGEDGEEANELGGLALTRHEWGELEIAAESADYVVVVR
jgi:hypothetical protein